VEATDADVDRTDDDDSHPRVRLDVNHVADGALVAVRQVAVEEELPRQVVAADEEAAEEVEAQVPLRDGNLLPHRSTRRA
jgi:hypothetical protein